MITDIITLKEKTIENIPELKNYYVSFTIRLSDNNVPGYDCAIFNRGETTIQHHVYCIEDFDIFLKEIKKYFLK